MKIKIDFSRLFHNKILIQAYFIFFIILNIADFLHYLEGDLDFFKKILSWIIIGYIFYKVSLSKIFVGEKIKKYDLGYIFAFCLMIIPRTLEYYITLIGENEIKNYIIFGGFLNFIKNIQGNNFIFQQTSLLIGIILIIFISIRLINKHYYTKDSLIGSMNFSEYMRFIKLDIITLIVVSLFFGIFVFNLIMEWFALAVDAIILVLGLIYYFFKYLHHHTQSKFSEYIKTASNTGNDFYQKLILAFSDKKTFFIGISFLLTLHLMVDGGVYMIPYTIGSENSLYFGKLGENHNPLFFSSSNADAQISKDMTSSPLFNLPIISIYIISLFLGFVFLTFPFYIFYKNIQNKKIKLNKIFTIFFITSTIFYISLFFFPNLNNPILIGFPDKFQDEYGTLKGVDIYTSNIIKTNNNISKTSFELISSFLLFLIILLLILFRYDKYKYFFEKITYLTILSFFIIYIGMYFIDMSRAGFETFNIKNNENLNSAEQYLSLEKIYFNKSYLKGKTIEGKISNSNMKIEITPFTDFQRNNKNILDHTDYIYFKIKNNKNNNFSFTNLKKIYFSDPSKYKNNKFELENFSFIYLLGKNYNKIYLDPLRYDITNLAKTKILNEIMEVNPKGKEDNLVNNYIKKPLEILLMIFGAFFYILGTATFSIYYFRKNIFN